MDNLIDGNLREQVHMWHSGRGKWWWRKELGLQDFVDTHHDYVTGMATGIESHPC